MMVTAAASLWLTLKWLVRSILVLPFDLIRFPFRSFTGLVLGGAVGGGLLLGVYAFGGGLTVEKRSAAYVGAIFLAALVARWRSARKKPLRERGWPRFLLAWLVGGPAAWLLTTHYLLTAGRRELLSPDWVFLLVLAWVVVAIVVRSDRLSRQLGRIWKADSDRRSDDVLVRSLRSAPPAPPADPAYAHWYAWTAAVTGGPVAAVHDATTAALAVVRSGGAPEAAAAAARRKRSGAATGLAALRRRWAAAMEAA